MRILSFLALFLCGMLAQAAEPGAITLKPMGKNAGEELVASGSLAYRVAPVGGALRIDGQPAEDSWKQAPPVGSFASAVNLPAEAKRWAEVKLLADSQALYLFARLAKPGGAYVAKATSAKEPVWKDHALEVSLQTPEMSAPRKVVVNGNAAVWTGGAEGGSWGLSEIRAAAANDAKTWRCELEIPWKALGLPAAPETLKMQMKYLQPDNSGWTMWSGVDQPAGWATVTIGSPSAEAAEVKIRRFVFPQAMTVGTNRVTVEVENPTGRTHQIAGRLITKPSAPPEASQTIDLPPHGSGSLDLLLPYDGNEGVRHTLSVTDATEGRTLLSVARPIRALQALRVRLDREQIWLGDQEIAGTVEVGASAEKGAQVQMELWDKVHRLSQAAAPLGETGRFDFSIDASQLPLGDYRCVVRTEGTAPEEEIVPIHLAQKMPLPRKQAVDLKVNWPAGDDFEGSVPLYAGLSFPAGTLLKESEVRLVDGQGKEIPLQTRVLATWGPGGSIKWLGLYFQGQKDRSYHAEFGSEVSRASGGRQVTVEDQAKAYVIDTGAARFEIPKSGPLLGRAWIGQTQLLEGGEGVLTVADQNGAVADETRGLASEAPAIVVSGPQQVVVKRQGLLRTADGKALGKYIVWMTFSAGVASVPIQHVFVVTNGSKEVQYSDLSFRVKPSLPQPWHAAFATAPDARDADVKSYMIDPSKGEGAYLFQSVFPHHQQTESVYEIGLKHGGQWKTDAKGAEAGEWAALWSGQGGVALVVPNLAKLFPKELEIGPSGLTAHLWSSRGERLLDYRPQTIVDYVGKEWVDKSHPKGSAWLANSFSDPIGSARTHDLTLTLFAPSGNVEHQAASLGRLAAHPPLALQDPQWLLQTGAIGNVYPYSPEKFPRVEAFLQQYFRHCIAEQAERAGDYGFLDYGVGPHFYKETDVPDPGSKPPKLGYRYSDTDYQLRTSLWLAYARSGDRAYFDYAVAKNRHLNDFKFSYWETKGKPLGAITDGFSSEDSMLYWVGHPGRYPGMDGHQGFDLENFLYQYYLTGDLRAVEAFPALQSWLLKNYTPAVLPNVGATASSFKPYGYAALLYAWSWDRRLAALVQQSRDRLVDLKTQVGLVNQDYYGSVYKPEVRMWSVLKDYEATGSQVAGAAVTKLAEYDLATEPMATCMYQDHDGAFFQVAYARTKDPAYLDWMTTRLDRLAYAFTTPEGKLRGSPYEGGSSSANILETVAYGLDLVARGGDRHQPRPIFFLSPLSPAADLYFLKPQSVAVHFDSLAGPGFNLGVVEAHPPIAEDFSGMYSGGVLIDWRPKFYRSVVFGLYDGLAKIQVPKEAVKGLYKLEKVTDVAACDAENLIMAMPNGAYLDGAMVDCPPYWFQVPAKASGEIYVSKEARLSIGAQMLDLAAGKWNPIAGEDADQMASLALGGSTFVQFRGGIPAAVARSESGWFLPEAGLPPAAAPAPAGGYHLGQGRKLGIPLGNQSQPGSYEFFHTQRGTLEFWVRPNWSATQATASSQHPIFRIGPKWTMIYNIVPPEALVGDRPENLLMGSPHLLTRVDFEGKHPGVDPQKLYNAAAFPGEQWHHIAFVWDTTPKDGWVSEVFVDGRPSSNFNRHGYGLSRYNAIAQKDPTAWQPATPGAEIEFSDLFDGSVDEVRISDTPRYTEAFTPPERHFEPDASTLLLLHLSDGIKAIAPHAAQPPAITTH